MERSSPEFQTLTKYHFEAMKDEKYKKFYLDSLDEAKKEKA